MEEHRHKHTMILERLTNLFRARFLGSMAGMYSIVKCPQAAQYIVVCVLAVAGVSALESYVQKDKILAKKE